MRNDKFNIDGYEFSENTPVTTQSSVREVTGDHEVSASTALKSSTAGRGKWARGSMVTCLLGSLLLTLVMLATPAKSSASVGIFVSFGPPAIPVYVQPACPAPGYIWTPGYWAWDPDYGYYWVPGTWVPAPFVGALWTPGYWGWYNDAYTWYPGYWGTEVGFYGGIDYGYGYPGRGYYGGQWRGGNYYYNRQVTHITNVNIVNVYNQRVVVNENNSRVSYNGGSGGIDARPTSTEMAAERSRRSGAVNEQMQQEQFARNDPAQRARENRGRPQIAATARPGEFSGKGAVRATRAGAPFKEPPREMNNGRGAGRSQPAPVERGPAMNAPRESAPNQRMERPNPAQQRNEPEMNAPRETPPNQRMERPAPMHQRNEPEMNAPRETAPNQRMERPNPAQQRNERQMERNNAPGRVQGNQHQSRPPEGRGAQERQDHQPNQGRHEGKNDNNPPHNQR